MVLLCRTAPYISSQTVACIRYLKERPVHLFWMVGGQQTLRLHKETF